MDGLVVVRYLLRAGEAVLVQRGIRRRYWDWVIKVREKTGAVSMTCNSGTDTGPHKETERERMGPSESVREVPYFHAPISVCIYFFTSFLGGP